MVTLKHKYHLLNSCAVRSKQRSFDNSSGNEQEESDRDIIQSVRSKSLQCYIYAWGVKPSITENIMCNYVQRRGVFVSWLNIRRTIAVSQINVDGDTGSRLFEEGFWPEGVQCRHWHINLTPITQYARA